MTNPTGPDRLRPAGMSLREWFRYADRMRFDPTSAATITTHRLTHDSRGDRERVDWEQEEWNVQSFLVPLDQEVANAPLRAAAANWAHDVEFTPYWEDARTFEFAEVSTLDDVIILRGCTCGSIRSRTSS